jgi:hypothetical protein
MLFAAGSFVGFLDTPGADIDLYPAGALKGKVPPFKNGGMV